MVQRHLLEQIELLKEHLEQDQPHPDFIERHAAAIMELAKDLPYPSTPCPLPPLYMVLRDHRA